MARQANVLVCDELYVTLTGKLTAMGIYTGDIIVPAPGVVVPHLIFLFLVETTSDDLFESIMLEATLPDHHPVRSSIPVPQFVFSEGRTRWGAKYPLLVQQPRLFPGRIIAKLIHDKREIIAFAQWIAIPPQPSPQN